MTKSKRQSKNLIFYLLDEFILSRREFAYDVNTSAENLVTVLQARKKNQDTLLRNERIMLNTRYQNNKWYFELGLERQNKNGIYVEYTQFTGSIYDNGLGSHIEGKNIEQGWGILTVLLALLGIVAWLYISLMDKPSYPPVHFLFPVCFCSSIFIPASIWLAAYSSQNQVLKFIKFVVESANGNDNKTQAS